MSSTEVVKVSSYRIGSEEFKTLSDAKTHVENKIGTVIDSMDVTLTPKQKLNILATIVENKKFLRPLLGVWYYDEDTDKHINVLDL